MPDICMCLDAQCPKRKDCYRFWATPTPNWQSFFEQSPRKGKECDAYWKRKPYNQKTKGK